MCVCVCVCVCVSVCVCVLIGDRQPNFILRINNVFLYSSNHSSVSCGCGPMKIDRLMAGFAYVARGAAAEGKPFSG